MPDALSEAIDALRVLGDPAKAWGGGLNKAKSMHDFANAARRRVVALRERETSKTNNQGDT